MPVEYDRMQPWVLPLATTREETIASLDGDWLAGRVGQPAPEIRGELLGRGFEFVEDLTDSMKHSLRDAALILREIVSLQAVVSRCVSKIVPLVAEPDYDISHSEPRWDALIFVSVAEGGDHRAALRSLENIVHEAMHVQLTRLENQMPLIVDQAATMPSPWRDNPRHLRGVLHGVYVFVCIRTCLIELTAKANLDASGRRYISSRMAQIDEELAQVELRRLSLGLTYEGRNFVESLPRPMYRRTK